MSTTFKKVAASAAAALTATTAFVAASAPAQAAARDGVCDTGEFCLFYNSDNAGAVSDFTTSIADYGTTQPSCYDFKGTKAGHGLCVKNEAASVWNRTGKSVAVYYNSSYAGASQTFAAGAKANLNATLKNNNASHRIGSGGSSSGFLLPFPCGESWEGQTRSNHSPSLAVDFNHYPDDLGWKVYASAPGTVTTVANLGNTSYGRYVVISHAGGYKTYYAHLSSQDVSVGQSVTAKTMIGRVGSTGGSTGPHLHYEQRLNGTVVKATFKDGSPAYPNNTTTLRRKQSCP
ncbi:peptidoglycan DD-metalloendopeptidase family protein [Phycicoccus jejuensis]|uniref:peptidoglycan DD-metalloendopeptidase family protein n=1 Tax=Phycicoccus jejuensis TaxID=367299 RepID=UPI00384F8E33